MISVAEAKHIIANNTSQLPPAAVPLLQAAGHTLAKEVCAIADIPAFEQSSMDGYAIKFADRFEELIIRGEMAAGADKALELGHAPTAIRIFTGAPLPVGADTVIMQEKVRVENNRLILLDDKMQQGNHVRNKGSEIKAGQKAVAKGTLLTPAAIGFLAGIGIVNVMIIPDPVVTIIITGNELTEPGFELHYGQVYESNSYSLQAALRKIAITPRKIVKAEDSPAILHSALTDALENSDVILLTGGVSVGDHDHVTAVAAACGVKQLLHKIKQRPGKPLYVGKMGNKLVFGLPGNPSSVLTCFYEYVLPVLEFMGTRKNSGTVIRAALGADHRKPAGLTHFLKGYYEEGIATPLQAQESFRLSSFAQSNCLILLEEERTDYLQGETVEVHLLPV